jgi:hypothetical protein
MSNNYLFKEVSSRVVWHKLTDVSAVLTADQRAPVNVGKLLPDYTPQYPRGQH